MTPPPLSKYMPNTTFTTFAGAGSRYKRDYPDEWNPNLGFRYKSKTAGGLNFSLNYLYDYDPNPYVELSWHDATTGEELSVHRAQGMFFGLAIVPDPSTDVARSQVPTDAAANPLANPTILLRNSAGQYYGAVDPTFGLVPGAYSTNPVELRFTEKLQRIHNLGGSFDYALDTDALAPIVFRGELLYQKDTKRPVIDNLLLGIGDLSNGLVMEDADMFKYVLGADITVFTNMMASFQFIRFRNLDFVNQNATCRTQTGLSFDVGYPHPHL